MNLSLDRVREIFPHFNERRITEEDFWRAAKKAKIVVKSIPLAVDGYYQHVRDRHYILINSRLTGLRWLHTALHEFCHYLFDVPCAMGSNTLYRRGGDMDAKERMADAFALIALLPLPELERLAHEDLTDDPWLLHICRDRIAVRVDYGE